MTRGSAQAGNRASKTERYLQWLENSPEWNAVTSAMDKLYNTSQFFVFGLGRAVSVSQKARRSQAQSGAEALGMSYFRYLCGWFCCASSLGKKWGEPLGIIIRSSRNPPFCFAWLPRSCGGALGWLCGFERELLDRFLNFATARPAAHYFVFGFRGVRFSIRLGSAVFASGGFGSELLHLQLS